MMANFYPFKYYITLSLDELIQKHSIQGPFLDVGCGSGDVALHLAQQDWSGEAIDVSDQAANVASQLLKPYPWVKVYKKEIDEYRERYFNLIMFLDVIEHLSKDNEILKSAASIQKPGGHLVITVPSNPEKEWRWDDEFYGHLRRYDPAEIESLLKTSGYKIIELWDISYPVFWILRRIFTAIKNPPNIKGDAWGRTQQSPFTNAWELGWLSNFLSDLTFWKPILMIQRKFRNKPERGHEMMVLARREAI
jgi:SAM-dependent methyltransferase